MNCSIVRKILYPDPARAETTIERAGALRHVAECAECQRYFAEQIELSRALKSKLGDEQAPDAMRARIGAQIDKRRSGAPRSFRWAGIAAAMVMILAAPSLWIYSRLHSASFFEEVCADHSKYLHAQAQLVSADPRQIEAWFRDKAEFGIHVPAYENAQLLGGRLCFLKRHKAALVFYRKGGHPVSLFELDASGVNLSALTRSEMDGARFWHSGFNGYSLIGFQERGVLYLLVSDLRESELLDLLIATPRYF